MSTTTLITNTLPASEPCRLCDAQIGEPHSAACPMGERYRQVQAMGGVPMPKMTREQAAAFLADDIDPALYGLPQDSEIGPEVYRNPDACRFCGEEPPHGARRLLPSHSPACAERWVRETMAATLDEVRYWIGKGQASSAGRQARILYRYGRKLTEPPAGWDVAEPGPEQTRPTVERWDNPVPVKCSARSSARAGQEMLPGGGEFSCHETASFLEMRNGEGVRFLCDRHGKERRQELREARP